MNDFIKKSSPTILYIILCIIILILSLEFIPNLGWPLKITLNLPAIVEYEFIHILPIVFSFLMIIPILYIINKPEVLTKRLNIELKPLEPTTDFRKVLLIGIYYTIVICIFRVFIVNTFTLPFEKLPMIWLMVFQILLVEECLLKDFGIHRERFKENIVLGTAYLFLMVIILIGPIVLLAILLFGPQLLVLWGQIFPYMMAPNYIFLVAFIYQALFVGLSEELIFRGWLYGKLRRSNTLKENKYGYFWAVFISSLIFGLFHLPWYVHFNGFYFDAARTFSLNNLGDAGLRVLSTGFFGIFMCIIYEKTQSLIAPIIIHGISNTIPLFLGSALFPLLYIDYMGILNTFIQSLFLSMASIIIFGIIIVVIAIPLLIIAIKYLTPWIVKLCKANFDN